MYRNVSPPPLYKVQKKHASDGDIFFALGFATRTCVKFGHGACSLCSSWVPCLVHAFVQLSKVEWISVLRKRCTAVYFLTLRKGWFSRYMSHVSVFYFFYLRCLIDNSCSLMVWEFSLWSVKIVAVVVVKLSLAHIVSLWCSWSGYDWFLFCVHRLVIFSLLPCMHNIIQSTYLNCLTK